MAGLCEGGNEPPCSLKATQQEERASRYESNKPKTIAARRQRKRKRAAAHASSVESVAVESIKHTERNIELSPRASTRVESRFTTKQDVVHKVLMFQSLKQIVTHDLARSMVFVLKRIQHLHLIDTFMKLKVYDSLLGYTKLSSGCVETHSVASCMIRTISTDVAGLPERLSSSTDPVLRLWFVKILILPLMDQICEIFTKTPTGPEHWINLSISHTLLQRFSNYGPSGPRVLSLWSFKKDRKK
ncbi:hypothetical protein ANN_22985 [Periplaneta americana]|uniref:Uncharacterized protein n=1 Tax=Periplaneta americana TaxID=6978 RepID=A0ABQ8SK98_PERAM|nr:hypothetical protein ANN_22985 [Periplaneta americana]